MSDHAVQCENPDSAAPGDMRRGSAPSSWGIGGWLLFLFLQRIGADAAQALKARVAAGLKTTFASHYTRTVSLAGALQAEAIADYGQRATASKVPVDPSA